MELRQLRYFQAVVDEGSFTAAAKRCGVAQPSLSQQILNLEEELGEPLFRRHPRHVELTDAGEVVLRHTRRILGETSEIERAFRDRGELLAGVVTVGIIPTMAPYLIPPVVRLFSEEHPGVRIRIREGRTSTLVESLAKGEIDFAIASDISSADRKRWSLHVRNLFTERLLLAVSSSHSFARRAGAIPLDEVPEKEIILLSEGHCLSEQTLKVCRLRRTEDRIECDQLETLLSLVAAGSGIGFVPEMAAGTVNDKRITLKHLREPEPERMISVVRRKAATLSPAADAFLRFFRTRAAE